MKPPGSRDSKAFRLISGEFLNAEFLHRRGPRPDCLPSILRHHAALERLDLSVCPSLDDDDVLVGSLTLVAPLLRSIILSRAIVIPKSGLEAMVPACPRLKAMDFSHCHGVGDCEVAALVATIVLWDLRLDKCPELEWLGIKWCMEISDIGIDLLIKKCRDLKGSIPV